MKVLVILISVLLVNVVFAQKRYQHIVETEYRGDTVVLISTKEPVTGIVYLENKEDGLLREVQYVNGIRNGYSKMISNNVVLTIENFKNGLIDGESKWYYENGQKKSEGFYKEGKQEGITKSWHPNGQIKYEVNVINDLYEGPLKVYFENGKVEYDKNYVQGKLEGKSTEYYESGKMKKMEFWKDGLLEGPSITFSENASNGLFTSKVSYKAGKRHGKCQWYYEKSVLVGQMQCEANYLEGKQHGITTWWYDNGQVLSKEKFINGDFHGVKKAWYSNGNIATIEKWESGKLISDKNWNESGTIVNDNFPITPPIGIFEE